MMKKSTINLFEYIERKFSLINSTNSIGHADIYLMKIV